MFLYLANNLKLSTRVFAVWAGLTTGFKIREEVLYGSLVDEYNDILANYHKNIQSIEKLPDVDQNGQRPADRRLIGARGRVLSQKTSTNAS